MITKFRGDTFWVYPTVANWGSPQAVRVWAGIIRPDGVAIPAIILRADMTTGESIEYTIGVYIPDDAPTGIYGVRILLYPGEGPTYIAIWEEVDVLEVSGIDKQIISVRYA